VYRLHEIYNSLTKSLVTHQPLKRSTDDLPMLVKSRVTQTWLDPGASARDVLLALYFDTVVVAIIETPKLPKGAKETMWFFYTSAQGLHEVFTLGWCGLRVVTTTGSCGWWVMILVGKGLTWLCSA
jgi:hypothetical protein